jgi:hypothetical protein
MVGRNRYITVSLYAIGIIFDLQSKGTDMSTWKTNRSLAPHQIHLYKNIVLA